MMKLLPSSLQIKAQYNILTDTIKQTSFQNLQGELDSHMDALSDKVRGHQAQQALSLGKVDMEASVMEVSPCSLFPHLHNFHYSLPTGSDIKCDVIRLATPTWRAGIATQTSTVASAAADLAVRNAPSVPPASSLCLSVLCTQTGSARFPAPSSSGQNNTYCRVLGGSTEIFVSRRLQDRDECLEISDLCGDQQKCLNTPGNNLLLDVMPASTSRAQDDCGALPPFLVQAVAGEAKSC